MMLSAFELPLYDDSFNSRISLTLSGLRDPIHAVQLSPDGKYLALGNDGGNLEIRNTEPDWERTRIYRARAKIRAICWHPSQERTLFVGCGNGNIYCLSFQVDQADMVNSGRVNGFVHALALNAKTNQLAVGFENSIVVIDKYFPTPDDLGSLKYLTTPVLEVKNGGQIGTTTYTMPRNLHYLSAEILLVGFFGDLGIVAYSTKSGDQLWKMDLLGSWAGSSALSPSGEYLAVTDLIRGVDWYSLSHRRFMMNTRYTPSEEPYKHNMVVGIGFLDENTVVVGHSCGKIVFCPFGMIQNPSTLKVGHRYQAIQTLCCGVVDGAMRVVAIVPVDERDEKLPHIEIAPIITIVRFQNQIKFAEREKECSERAKAMDIPQATGKLIESTGNKRFIGVGRLMFASIIIFAGLLQYQQQDANSHPEKTEHLQLSHRAPTRDIPCPIRVSTVTRMKTISETTTTTETTTRSMETSTVTNAIRETETFTEWATVTSTLISAEATTLMQTITAKAGIDQACICTATNTVLGSRNIGEGEVDH